MPAYLATYDIQRANPDPHSEFIEQARKKGWETWILSTNNIWFKLPNTTLVGSFNNQEEALLSFKSISGATASQGYSVKVEKYIVVEYTRSNFQSDVTQKKT